jgi:hypothetical protein
MVILYCSFSGMLGCHPSVMLYCLDLSFYLCVFFLLCTFLLLHTFLLDVPQLHTLYISLFFHARFLYLGVFCNVPTLGHHHRAKTYDDQSSHMDVIASTGVFERHCGVQLAFIIIFHHYEPFHIGWLWFRSIPTISMILTILSYKLIKITEEGILRHITWRNLSV